jgi:small subunit ribosomal protein S24e
MELKIISNNENRLLNRKEIRFSVVQEGGTVNRAELTKELCKKLSLHPESTIITRIDQGYGMRESTGIAHAYQTKETLEKYEPKKVLARTAKKAAKQQAVKAEPKAEGSEKKE